MRICLAKEPDQRFQSAHDLKLQLQWIAAGGSQVGAPAVVVSQRKSRRKILAAAAAAGWLAAIAVAVLALLLSSEVRQAQRPVAAEINPPAGADFTGAVQGPAAISPDGKELAFIAGNPKGSRLWMRDMATGRTAQFLSIASAGWRVQMFPILSPTRLLAVRLWSCFLKGQVQTARRSCHSSRPCWNQPWNYAVRLRLRPSSMRSMKVRSPMRCATGGT